MIVNKEKVIGMLSLDQGELNCYTPRHAELAFAFAGQVRYVTTPDECHAHRHASAFEWNAQCSVAPHAGIMGIKE